jgi:hypothetical protein
MRRLILCTFAVLVCLAEGRAQGFSFARGGIGFNVAFVVTDAAETDMAFDAAVCGDVAFSLGRYGEVHYKPNVGVWFGGRHREVVYWYQAVRYVENEDWFALEVHLDFADFAYYFPLPEHIIFRPYAGLGPMVAIRHRSYHYPDPDVYYDYNYTGASMGFNVFGGGEFRVSPVFSAYIEMRGRVGRWDLFKLIGGARWTLGGR